MLARALRDSSRATASARVDAACTSAPRRQAIAMRSPISIAGATARITRRGVWVHL
jgi:hypothetical protein